MGKAGGCALGVEKIKPVAVRSPRAQIAECIFARLHIIAVCEPERGDPLRCGVRFSGVGTQRDRAAHASALSGSTT